MGEGGGDTTLYLAGSRMFPKRLASPSGMSGERGWL